MREQVCFEHHMHDESCFTDPEENLRKHREWCRQQCKQGWPQPGWSKPELAPRQHAPIKIDESWLYCPLCGRRVR